MKFSDALRGAADRAPVDQVHVSTPGVNGANKAGPVGADGCDQLGGCWRCGGDRVGGRRPPGCGKQENGDADAAGRDGAAMTEESATADAPMEAMDGAAG